MNGTAELHELFNCCLSANYKFVQFVQFVVWKLFHCFDTSSFFIALNSSKFGEMS